MIPDEITNRQSEHNDNCNLGYFHGARVCLTSRAQARGTRMREPRSGTESAIPRCLQRFVRLKLIYIHINPVVATA
jgi:hypothetical protein